MAGHARRRRRAARGVGSGFTLVELLVVLVLMALASGLVGLALRDPAAARLDQEALRLAALLEAGRAESRASGLEVRFELSTADTEAAFRFVGLPSRTNLPQRWLNDGVRAEIAGARSLRLGPEPLIGAQRITLQLDAQRVTLATDGLAPFAPLEPGATP